MTIRGWLLCLLAVAPAFGARNLLPNNSFEQGDQGWTCWRGDPATSSGTVEPNGAMFGTHAFHVVNRGEAGANLFSDPVPVQAGRPYTLSVYVKTKDAEDVKISGWTRDATGEIVSYSDGGFTAVPSNVPHYARVFKVFYPADNAVTAQAHLVCNGGEVWWDAVQLEASLDMELYNDGPVLGATSRNLVDNPELVGNGSSWHFWTNGATSGEAVDGAWQVTNRSPDRAGANVYSDTFPAEPGQTYTLSVDVRCRGLEGRLGLWAVDADDQPLVYHLDGAVSPPADLPEAKRLTVTSVAPEGCAGLRVHLCCAQGEVWWSRPQVEEGDQATAYDPGPRLWFDDPQRGREAGRRYTELMVQEAWLRQVASAAGRLATSQPALAAKLAAARKPLDALTASLEPEAIVPGYEQLDARLATERLAAARAGLTTVFEAAGLPAPDLGPWCPPKFEGVLTAERLSHEFVLFPLLWSARLDAGEDDWGLLEPYGFRVITYPAFARYRDGRTETSGIEAALATVAAHGYRLQATTSLPFADLPGAKAGEIFLHNAEGDWSPSGNCHHTFNLWHPTVLEASDRLHAAIAEKLGRDPRVAALEVINEPSLSIERRVQGYRYERLGIGGYSPEAVAAYRDWLQRKYGTITAVNARYGTTWTGFEQAAPPPDVTPPTPVNATSPLPGIAAIVDFQRFRAESHAGYFQRAVDALHRHGMKQAVMGQWWAGDIGRLEAAVDLHLANEVPSWDFHSTHDWDAGGPALKALYADAANRHAQRPQYEDEFIWSQWERKFTPESVMRAAVRRNLLRQLAWGKRGISLFNWMKEWLHDSPRSWNNSAVNLEADRHVMKYGTGAIPVVERLGNLVKDELYPTRRIDEGLAILISPTSQAASAPTSAAVRASNAVASHWLTANRQPTMLHEQAIADGRDNLSEFKVLALPQAAVLPASTQAQLLSWLQSGGVILADAPPGLFDETGRSDGRLLGRLDRASLGFDEKLGWQGGPQTLDVGQGRVVLTCGIWSKETDWAPLDAVLPAPLVSTTMPHVELLLRRAEDGTRYAWVINLSSTEAAAGTVTFALPVAAAHEITTPGAPEAKVGQAGPMGSIDLLLEPGDGVCWRLK